MDISYEHYRIFYYVAKYENITRASRALMTSQPAITRCLRNLEQELGCRLLIRSTKGVTLTPEGRTLYAHVAPACDLIAQGENALTSAMGLKNGMIYLVASETALHALLMEKLDKFHRLYPEVRLKILNSTTPEAVTSLKSGQVDMAVVASAGTEPEKPLRKTKLRTFRYRLLAGTQFSQLAGRDWQLRELDGYPLVCLAQGTMTRDFFEEYYLAQGLKLRPDIEVETVDLLLPMIRHNLGLGFVPERLAETALQSGEVLPVELVQPPEERYICLLENMSQPLSAAAGEFRRILLEDAANG